MRTIIAMGLVAAATILTSIACGGADATAPSKPPYLALVSLFDVPPDPDVEANFGYWVQDIAGASTLDTVIRTTTADTVILPLPQSTYRVTLVGLPMRCLPREGSQQNVPLANIKGFNTNIARYHISCRHALSIMVYSFGPGEDNEFIYTLTREGDAEQLGTLSGDTAQFFKTVEPGWYTLTLGHVAGHCAVISDGGATQRFEIPPTGGVSRSFSVSCSDLTKRPKVVLLRGSYHDGAVAMVIRATDPDRDLAKFFWDVTDCSGTSVRTGGAVERQGIAFQRLTADTAIFLVANQLRVPDAEMQERCVAARVTDDRGNTTAWHESPLTATGTPPSATRFNAVLVGQQAIRIELDATDADGDFVGMVVAGRIRDGVLHPADGFDDFLYRNAEGYLSTTVPDFPVGSPYPGYLDVNGLAVYLIDAAGNFSVYIDEDTFR